MRYEHVCKRRGRVSYIRSTLKPAQKVADKSIYHRRRLVIWVKRIFVGLICAACIDAGLVSLVVHDEHGQSLAHIGWCVIEPSDQAPQDRTVLLDYKQHWLRTLQC